jgi:hypothetical protein
MLSSAWFVDTAVRCRNANPLALFKTVTSAATAERFPRIGRDAVRHRHRTAAVVHDMNAKVLISSSHGLRKSCKPIYFSYRSAMREAGRRTRSRVGNLLLHRIYPLDFYAFCN